MPLQLTLECHGFELQRSIYMWIFFSYKYYGTDSLWLVESADVELQIWRSHVVIGWFFDLMEGWCPQVLSCSRVNCVLKDSFLYTTLRICHPTASCPSLFLMISWFLISLSFLVCDELFFSFCFKDFLCILRFQHLDCDVYKCGFLFVYLSWG